MTVQRYDLEHDYNSAGMVESDDGDWVRYEDYESHMKNASDLVDLLAGRVYALENNLDKDRK